MLTRFKDMKRENYLRVRDHARQMRQEMTWAERKLWEAIRHRKCGGYRFLRQRVVGRFILDFYCAEKRLAIEVDGGIHLRPDVAEYDAMREEGLKEEYRLHFLRLTNAEVLRLSEAELQYHVLEFIAGI